MLIVAFCCCSAFAQIQQVPAQRVLPDKTTLTNRHALRSVQQKITLNPVTTEAVYDRPEGTTVVASENSTGIFSYYGYVLDQATEHRGMTFVQTDDAIWIEAPFTQYFEGDYGAVGKQGWLRLDKTTSGYVCHLPQAIITSTDASGKSTTYYATRMTGSTSSMEYKAVSSQNVNFTVDDNGVVKQKTSTGSELIGLTDGSGNWLGYGDYGLTFAPNYDTPVEFPADLKTEQYVWSNDITKSGDTFEQFVNVGFVGNEVYFSNVADTDQYFKGTIEGDKCYVKNDQYMGLSEDNGYIFYMRACKFNWKEATEDDAKTYSYEFLPNDETIVFDYDPATKRFTLPEGLAFCANIDNADDFFKNLSPNLRLFPFVETAATPVDPYFFNPDNYFTNYAWNANYQMGYGSVEAVFSPHDAEGNYLNPSKMYFRMFIDDETTPYVFSSADYDDLPEDNMTEIPLELSTYDILQYSPSLRLIFFYQDVAERIGFQSVYYGGDERHESDITWYYPIHKLADSANFSDKVAAWGSNKLENYAVAVSLKDPSLVGMTVTKITIPFATSVKGLTNGKVFLTKELQTKIGENGERANFPDISEQAFTIKGGNVEVVLDEPYIIPEGGIYVGYSFDETSLSATPLQVVSKASPGNFYLFTSRTYPTWSDRSERLGISTAMKVTLDSENQNAASVAFEGVTTQLGDKPQIKLTISNHGAQPIKNIDYSYVEGSLTGTKHATFSTAIPAELGASATTTLTLPAQVEAGNIDLTITIDKVNGEANQDANPAATATMKVYSFIPTYRPLLEEYTGTGCGWCPRGLVGLDKMLEIYPDEFVAISYHQYNGDDAMYFGDSFSNAISGFPAAVFNRNHSTDAYYGDNGSSSNSFGLDKTFEQIRKGVIPPADVWVEAHYKSDDADSADSFKVEATANASFPLDEADNHYAFALFAIGNEMSGKGNGWAQANYYSGNSNPPAGLEAYASAGSYYTKQVYNLVALAWSGNTYVKNSLPKTIVGNETYTYTRTLDLSGKSGIIADKNKVQVLVALIDTTDGHVVNANKVDVTSLADYTGIVSPILAGGNRNAAEIYTLDGKRVSALRPGVNLVRSSDGSVKKVIDIMR